MPIQSVNSVNHDDLAWVSLNKKRTNVSHDELNHQPMGAVAFRHDEPMFSGARPVTSQADMMNLPKANNARAFYMPAMSQSLRFGITAPNFATVLAATASSSSLYTEEVMPITQYIGEMIQNPRLARNSHQRVYDMIMEQGTRIIEKNEERVRVYDFFNNPRDGRPSYYGNEESTWALMRHLKKTTWDKNARKRMILLVGPPSSGKSMLATQLQKGLINYSRTDNGKIYTLAFQKLPTEVSRALDIQEDHYQDPFYVNPAWVLPKDTRQAYENILNGRAFVADDGHIVNVGVIRENKTEGSGGFVQKDILRKTDGTSVMPTVIEGSIDEAKGTISVQDGKPNVPIAEFKTPTLVKHRGYNVAVVYEGKLHNLSRMSVKYGDDELKGGDTVPEPELATLTAEKLTADAPPDTPIGKGVDVADNQNEFGYTFDITSQNMPVGSKKVFQELIKYYTRKQMGEPSNRLSASVAEQQAAVKAMDHVVARRFIIDVEERQGIANITAKDQKSQEVEEMIGELDTAKMGRKATSHFQSYDWEAGAFFNASGGILEFIEALKLDKVHLLPLMNLCEERNVKPKGQPLTDVDTLVIAHTNVPEFEKKSNDPELAALFTRIKALKVPYILETSANEHIIDDIIDRHPNRSKIDIAPHTAANMALFFTMGALQPIKHDKVKEGVDGLLTKALLYDGGRESDIAPRDVAKWRREGVQANEGMDGIPIRGLEDTVADLLSLERPGGDDVVDTSVFLGYMKDFLNGAMHDASRTAIANRDKALKLIPVVEKHFMDQVDADVTTAINADPETLKKNYADRYISNVMGFAEGKDVPDARLGGKKSKPDEAYMRKVERELVKLGMVIQVPADGADVTGSQREHRNALAASWGIYKGTHGEFPDLTLESKFRTAFAKIAAAEASASVNIDALLAVNPSRNEQETLDKVVDRMCKAPLNYTRASALRALHIYRGRRASKAS